MVKTLTFMVGFLAAVGGASVVASTPVPRPAPLALASAAPAAPQPVAEEARWTRTPVLVRSTDGYRRVAALDAPRDVNAPPPAAVTAAPIPLPPPRPPSTEWLLEGDRAFLAGWCRSEREARRMCAMMREPRRSGGEAREARGRRGGGYQRTARHQRPVVHIRRSDRDRAHAARRPAAPAFAAWRWPFWQ